MIKLILGIIKLQKAKIDNLFAQYKYNKFNKELGPYFESYKYTYISYVEGRVTPKYNAPVRKDIKKIGIIELFIAVLQGNKNKNLYTQYKLAWFYEYCTHEYEKAVKWYCKAAEQGLVEAQTSLGICLKEGKGVSRNKTDAARWFRNAAEQDFPEAQYHLGLCYEEGDGVPSDTGEALTWYRKAGENGNIYAANRHEKLYKKRLLFRNLSLPPRRRVDICLSMAPPPRRGPFG